MPARQSPCDGNIVTERFRIDRDSQMLGDSRIYRGVVDLQGGVGDGERRSQVSRMARGVDRSDRSHMPVQQCFNWAIIRSMACSPF